jgi:hypothetical protein
MSIKYEVPRGTTFLILQLLHPFKVQIFSSAPCSQTAPVYAISLTFETKFHTRTKQLVELWFFGSWVVLPKNPSWSEALITLLNKSGVLRWGVVRTSPNPQSGGPPPVDCSRLLIKYIRSYPPYPEAVSSTHNLRTPHALVTVDPLGMICICNGCINYIYCNTYYKD